MALTIFRRTERMPNLLAVEWVGLGYLILTASFVFFLFNRLADPSVMLLNRVWIALGVVCCYLLYRCYPCRTTHLLRIVYQLALLAYWYPETYDFNICFTNLDHLFAQVDQTLFGCQPSVLFSQCVTAWWWSEAFNMGYFAYYPMIVGVVMFYFFCRYEELNRVAYILVASFFVYYLIYIYVPVAGPQYYFPAVGESAVVQANFLHVGDYFTHNRTLLAAPGDSSGLFYNLVANSQAAGEEPTAAFPSSHVGISTILMILACRAKKVFAALLLPFYLLLCCATVYIQAHYLIDSLCGFLSAWIIYFALSRVWTLIPRNRSVVLR